MEELNLAENERWVEGVNDKRCRRELEYCDNCKQFVSKSTFYRHCLEHKPLPLTQPITPPEPIAETATVVDERIVLE